VNNQYHCHGNQNHEMTSLIANSIYRTGLKAISCNKQFSITSDKIYDHSQPVFFHCPLDEIVTKELKSIGSFLHFSIKKSDLEIIEKSELNIYHLVEYLSGISSGNFSYNGSRLYVYILGNSAFFIVKRITDYLFARIFNYDTAEDLLYYTQLCFQTLQLDKSDQLILCGEIESDSKIARTLAIYYSNFKTDSSLPLSTLVQ
jgi:hypothetical protein